jgi:PAS domain S-box-containing protein
MIPTLNGLGAEHFIRLVAQLPVIVWSTDTEHRVIARFGGGLAPFGLPSGVGDGPEVESFVDPADADIVVAAHRGALRGESTSYVTSFRGRTFRACVDPLRDAHGVITGAVGLAVDITETRRAEAALRASEARFRAIIETEPECVKLVDARGCLLDMNPAGLAMIEADDVAQVRGMPIARVIAEEHRAAFTALHDAVIRGGSGTLEYEIVGLRGTRRWLDTHAVPLRDPTGDSVVALSITRDISDRKLAEKALRELQERLRLINLATNDAVWDWDLVTNALWFGHGFETLFWYTREEIEPGIEAWTSRLHPDDRDSVLASIYGAINGGQTTWSREYRFRRGDGSYADVHDRGYVMHDPRTHAPIRMVGSMMDVTERKRAQEQLQASRAALRLLAARQHEVRECERTRIAREIHDTLGQALTALKLQLAAAQTAAAEQAPALEHRLSETALMVDDLVKTVRRIATELRPPVLDQLGLSAAIEWLAGDFSRRTGITCEPRLLPTNGAINSELATALFRIVQEALTNVSRHAGASHVSLELGITSGCVTLDVSDDGRGITEAAATGPGSLGILGMRERAGALGGVLEVAPRSGGGTRVTAWFPPSPMSSAAR